MAENLGSYVRFWARRFPNRAAIRFGGSTITWGQLDHETDRLAAGLSAAGIGHGDVVGVLMRNRPEFIKVVLATFKLGAIVALLNPRLTGHEMAHPLDDTAARLVVTEPSLANLLEKGVANNPELQIYSTEAAEGCSLLETLATGHGPGPVVEVDANDVALISYSSGTTGTPKGVLLTHGSLRASASARPVADGITWRDNLLIPIPLAFAGGMCYYIREALLIGATTILAPDSDPERLLDLIGTEQVANWGSVAVIFQMVMSHERFETADLSSLKFVQAGGGPIPIEMLRRWRERDVHVAEGYGLTETSGECSTILFSDEAEAHNGSAGRPLINRAVRIVSDDGTTLGPDEEGRIFLSGPSLMKGYLNQEAETDAVLSDGWLDTGDRGSLDDNGYLMVLGRTKDMFISGGINVYPAEIELTLTGVLPGLEEIAIIGMDHSRWGQVPLIVVPDANCIDIQQLQYFCELQLADYKRPRYLVGYGGPLPRNMNGKLVKMPLREKYEAAGHDGVIQLPRSPKT